MPRLPKLPIKSDLGSPLPASSSAPPTRLPVNPRRKKVKPDERKRVATACNSCNVRRIKCSGHKPCQQCAAATRDCEYPEPVLKKTIPQVEYDGLVLVGKWAVEVFTEQNGYGYVSALTPRARKRAADLLLATITANAARGSIASSSVDRMQLDEDTESGSVPPDAHFGRNDIVMDDGRGKLLEDPAGTKRYLGRTSGATFLDWMREFMETTSKAIAKRNPRNPPEFDAEFINYRGRYQTFDSRPLVLPDRIDPLELPHPHEIDRMLKVLRACLQDGDPEQNQVFPSGGIFFWPLENAEWLVASWNDTARGSPRNPQAKQDFRWLAKYQAAFALATLLQQKAPNSRVEGQLGDIYFERASQLLGNPLDVSNQFRLEDVPAMSLMALYLLENNRRDKARYYVRTAVDICVEHGANGIASANPPQQSQQRQFWSLYILDRWLSCLMGRPPYYPDDTRSMTLPKPQDCLGLPPSVGLRAHVELSEISTYIVRNNYKTPSVDEAPRFIKAAHAKLQAWKDSLPSVLQLPKPPGFDPYDERRAAGLEYEGIDRAVFMLHMAHHQLYILTIRPMFLVFVRRKVARALNRALDDEDVPSTDTDESREREAMLNTCSELARDTISLALTVRNLPDNLMLIQDLHHVFNAALILLLNQMYYVNVLTTDTARIAEAIRIFEKEAETGNAYCIDCVGVLKNLHRLVNQLRPAIFEGTTIQIKPESGLAPGEGILASLSLPDPTPEPAMDIDHPVFALHSLRNASPGSTEKGSPGQASVSASPASEVSEMLKNWEVTPDMALYSDGWCMVDMVDRTR